MKLEAVIRVQGMVSQIGEETFPPEEGIVFRGLPPEAHLFADGALIGRLINWPRGVGESIREYGTPDSPVALVITETELDVILDMPALAGDTAGALAALEGLPAKLDAQGLDGLGNDVSLAIGLLRGERTA